MQFDQLKRRDFITLLGGAAASWPLAARAQTKQMRRIGVLMGLVASDPEAQSRVVAFENGLRELGWVKGRNLSIEYRWAGDGNVRDHATELLAMAPDLILANSTPVTTALREQSRAVPIVFTQVADPVGQGLVPNLAHPGGNLTGFTSFEFSIGTKWLEALKQTAPRVTRVALAFNPQSGRSPTCSCGRSRPRRHPSQWRRSGPPCATPSMSIAYSIRSRANLMAV
jgi:putative ABC transport system substrate-binding protein